MNSIPSVIAPTITRIEGDYYREVVHGTAHGLLLTATIAPPREAVTRADPLERLQDYQGALSFYLKLPSKFVNKIVFVDNSDSDLQPLIDVARSVPHDKVIEFITFAGNDHPVSYGKVYGEFKLMDIGLASSSLFGRYDRFWKITGRLRLANIVDMIKAVSRPADLICDLHDFPLVSTGRLRRNRFMELRSFCCTLDVYDRLFRGCYESLGSKLSADYLYDVVMQARSRLAVIPRFPVQPRFAGRSGRHDRAYDSGVQALKTSVRAVLRAVAPWAWV